MDVDEYGVLIREYRQAAQEIERLLDEPSSAHLGQGLPARSLTLDDLRRWDDAIARERRAIDALSLFRAGAADEQP